MNLDTFKALVNAAPKPGSSQPVEHSDWGRSHDDDDRHHRRSFFDPDSDMSARSDRSAESPSVGVQARSKPPGSNPVQVPGASGRVDAATW